MLLRPVVLLLLCVSAGMCATLVFYPTPDNEDESPAVVDAAAVADSIDAAGKVSAGDSPAAEEPKANSLVGENLIDGTLSRGKPEVDVSVADGAAAKKLQTDVDGPAGGTPALEDAAAGKDATHMSPSSSSPPVDEGNDIKPVQNIQKRPKPQEESSWSINSIRKSFQSAHGYLNSLVELVGGPNGVCQYRCRYGESPPLIYVTEMLQNTLMFFFSKETHIYISQCSFKHTHTFQIKFIFMPSPSNICSF